MEFPSMLTDVNQIVVGLVVYHVYGHIPVNTPTKEIITSEIKKTEYGEYYFDVSFNEYSYCHFIGDVGLKEHKHNTNRLFTDYDEAVAYHQYCKDLGYQNGWNNQYSH